MKFSKEYLLNNKEKTIKFLVFAIIVVVALFVFIVRTGDNEGRFTSSTSIASSEEATETSSDIVICDVSGAVKSPQVVELEKGARIGDAIDKAGGLTAKADISNINRAAVVNDGDKILIPEAGQSSQSDSQISTDPQTTNEPLNSPDKGIDNNQSASGKININSADSATLQQINGIGPVTADKIIEYRKTNGGFTKIEDLKNVNGIGDKTFEKMKDYVTI